MGAESLGIRQNVSIVPIFQDFATHDLNAAYYSSCWQFARLLLDLCPEFQFARCQRRIEIDSLSYIRRARAIFLALLPKKYHFNEWLADADGSVNPAQISPFNRMVSVQMQCA